VNHAQRSSVSVVRDVEIERDRVQAAFFYWDAVPSPGFTPLGNGRWRCWCAVFNREKNADTHVDAGIGGGPSQLSVIYFNRVVSQKTIEAMIRECWWHLKWKHVGEN
jgi:hypothetical protein